MNIEKPKWYSNLKLWREENGCTGELWDIYIDVIKEKVMNALYSGFVLGFLFGIAVYYLYNHLRS